MSGNVQDVKKKEKEVPEKGVAVPSKKRSRGVDEEEDNGEDGSLDEASKKQRKVKAAPKDAKTSSKDVKMTSKDAKVSGS